MLGPKKSSTYSSEYASDFSGPAASHLAAPPSPRHEGNVGQAPRLRLRVKRRSGSVKRRTCATGAIRKVGVRSSEHLKLFPSRQPRNSTFNIYHSTFPMRITRPAFLASLALRAYRALPVTMRRHPAAHSDVHRLTRRRTGFSGRVQAGSWIDLYTAAPSPTSYVSYCCVSTGGFALSNRCGSSNKYGDCLVKIRWRNSSDHIPCLLTVFTGNR